MKTDIEREFLIDDVLAKEAEWQEQERLYEEDRRKQLPAVIRVMIPNFLKEKHETRHN